MRYKSEKISAYYKKMNHVGSFFDSGNSKKKTNQKVGVGLVGSPACGDVMKLEIKVANDNVIQDARLLVFGCGSAKAASSLAVEMLINKTFDEALKIRDEDIAKELGLPKIKMHCSVLAESVIRRAIEDYQNKYLSGVTDAKQAPNNDTNNNINNDINSDADSKSRPLNHNASLDITISKTAVKFIKTALEKYKKNNAFGVAINLVASKCGMSYKTTPVNHKTVLDKYICLTRDGLQIFVAKEIAEVVNGTRIDYKTEGLKSGIIFSNPNEASRCSCGTNFKIKGK